MDKRPPAGNSAKPWQPPPAGTKAFLERWAKIPPGTMERIIARQQAEEANEPLLAVAYVRASKGEADPLPNAYLLELAYRLRQDGLPEPIPDLVGPVAEAYFDRLDPAQLRQLTEAMCLAFKHRPKLEPVKAEQRLPFDYPELEPGADWEPWLYGLHLYLLSPLRNAALRLLPNGVWAPAIAALIEREGEPVAPPRYQEWAMDDGRRFLMDQDALTCIETTGGKWRFAIARVVERDGHPVAPTFPPSTRFLDFEETPDRCVINSLPATVIELDGAQVAFKAGFENATKPGPDWRPFSYNGRTVWVDAKGIESAELRDGAWFWNPTPATSVLADGEPVMDAGGRGKVGPFPPGTLFYDVEGAPVAIIATSAGFDVWAFDGPESRRFSLSSVLRNGRKVDAEAFDRLRAKSVTEPTFADRLRFFDVEGTPVAIVPMPDGGFDVRAFDGPESRRFSLSSLMRNGGEVDEATFERLKAKFQAGSRDNSVDDKFILATFPVGTRFFDVEGTPVAISPLPDGGMRLGAYDPELRFFSMSSVERNGMEVDAAAFDRLRAKFQAGSRNDTLDDKSPLKGVRETLDLLAKVPPGTFAGIIAQNDEDDRKFLESLQGGSPPSSTGDSYLRTLQADLAQAGLPTPIPDLSQPIPKDFLRKLDANQIGELMGVMTVVNLRKLSNDQ